MKTIYKTIVVLAMFFVPGMACASLSSPSDCGDTIPVVPRCEKYYYTKWIDECSNYYPNCVVDSCLCLLFQFHNYTCDQSMAKWEHTHGGRMKVDGLVAIVNHYNPPTVDTDSVIHKLPEYMYLYQLTGRHNTFLTDIEDGVDLVLLDSVRWDTATARVMKFSRGWNGEHTQYCYLYEAYFENPVYVDSDFYIYGSTNCNYLGCGRDGIIPTIYLDIMNFGDYILRDGCDIKDYTDILHNDDCPSDNGAAGGWAAIIDCLLPQLGWYTPWPYSPVGYYLPIVKQWNLNAVPSDASFGDVIGGGRWPDDSYDTIEAVPIPGYSFYEWNDGNTDNPRVIHLTSDTSFVAIFYANQLFNLNVSSSDDTAGTVTGGGRYHGETDNTISAVPNHGYKFLHWNDGVADSIRVIHLVSDTAFVAYFAEKTHYNVQAATNNDEWGTVNGGGIYVEGEEATLTVTTMPFCVFEGWSDGVWQLPRIVTVTRDTLFTAMLSFDSARAADIDVAGTLHFTVAPNPTTGRLTIQMDESERYEMTLLDINGKALVNATSEVKTAEMDISLLPAGQYFLVVRAKDKYGIKAIVKH